MTNPENFLLVGIPEPKSRLAEFVQSIGGVLVTAAIILVPTTLYFSGHTYAAGAVAALIALAGGTWYGVDHYRAKRDE